MHGDIWPVVGLIVLGSSITFFVRAAFRLRFPKSSGGDMWYHLHACEQIRKNGFRMPRRLNGYSLRTRFDTPSFLYLILALIPKRWREKDFLFGPLADSFQSIAVFILTYLLVKNYYLAFPSSLSFALAPILIKADARVFFLSPRPWAELFASLSLVFGVFSYVRFDFLSFLLAALFGSLTLLTGKFGAQALCFISVGLTIILLTWIFLATLLLSFFIAVSLSRGYYLRVLRGHIRHSNLYRTTIVQRHSGTTQVAGFRELVESLRRKRGVATAFISNPIFNVIAYLPLLPTMWIWFFLSPDLILGSPILRSLFLWSTVAFAIVVVVSTKQLRFLGEAERYQNYAVLPVCVATGALFGTSDSFSTWFFFVGLLLYSAILIWHNSRVAYRYFGQTEKDERDFLDLKDWLDQQPPRTILCVPINISPEVTYKTGRKTVYWGGSLPASDLNSEDFARMFDNFPYPRNRLHEFCTKHNADYLLFHKRFMGSIRPSDYNLREFTMVFCNEGFEVYQIQES